MTTRSGDARGGRVVFVAHCLLNQNTRYPGGAVCSGVVFDALRQHVEGGEGVVQMPCPEQRVWGGVRKRWLLWLIAHPRSARAVRPLLPLLERYLHSRYARIARRVGADVADYAAGGMQVTGIVGVAGSPSCGVHRTLDLAAATSAIAVQHGRGNRNGDWLRAVVVEPATCDGRGIFVDELARDLARRRLDVALNECDLRSVQERGGCDGQDRALRAPG